jgi:hypothetical protein
LYKPAGQKINFPKAEEEILEFWEKNDIFKKSIAQREGDALNPPAGAEETRPLVGRAAA